MNMLMYSFCNITSLRSCPHITQVCVYVCAVACGLLRQNHRFLKHHSHEMLIKIRNSVKINFDNLPFYCNKVTSFLLQMDNYLTLM